MLLSVPTSELPWCYHLFQLSQTFDRQRRTVEDARSRRDIAADFKTPAFKSHLRSARWRDLGFFFGHCGAPRCAAYTLGSTVQGWVLYKLSRLRTRPTAVASCKLYLSLQLPNPALCLPSTGPSFAAKSTAAGTAACGPQWFWSAGSALRLILKTRDRGGHPHCQSRA